MQVRIPNFTKIGWILAELGPVHFGASLCGWMGWGIPDQKQCLSSLARLGLDWAGLSQCSNNDSTDAALISVDESRPKSAM